MSSSESDTNTDSNKQTRVAIHKKNQLPKRAACQSTSSSEFHFVNNQVPSTSWQSNSWSRDSLVTSTPGHESLEHKLIITDNELCKNAKKRRSVSPNSPERERTIDTDSRDTSLKGKLQLSGNGKPHATSGLRRTLHGNVYQLKHLVLILHRVWKRDCLFRLSTEMDAAEKFDDLVLHYQDSAGDEVHRFLQLKHKQDEDGTIGAFQLLDINDGDFSVLKYFISWRKIKKDPDFGGSRFKNFILCTNIGLDVEGLEAAGINVSEVKEQDEFLKVTNRKKQPPRYKLLLDKKSQLCDTLKSASDIHQLAKVLAHCVCVSKRIDLTQQIFKYYHIALVKEVIDIQKKRFSNNFIGNKNLSTSAESFRSIFIMYIGNDTWKSSENGSLKVSSTFGKINKSSFQSEQNAFTELPEDLINDKEIADFLDEFILAVDQPSEVELGKMIKQELNADSQFNLLNADFIGDSFQNKILDWFKETGKYGRFLANKDAEDFFNEIEIKLSSLITMGLSLEYPEVLKKYDIQFETHIEELEIFLTNCNRNSNQILVLASPSSLLTALRVHQTITQIEKFSKNDSFIFIRLRTLLLPKIMYRVLRAFEWPHNHDLLVVDCESIRANDYMEQLWDPLCDILVENREKRIILVTEKTEASTIQFEIGHRTYYENEDDTSIDSLKKHSKWKLLEKTIISFQGHEEKTNLGKLLGIYNMDNSKVVEFKNLRRIIDSDTLINIIQDAEIQIGNKVEGLGEIKDYYVPRTIFDHKAVRLDILGAHDIPDLFAISGMDKKELKKLVPTILLKKCHILNNYAEENEFKTLCEQNSECNIHWLVAENGKNLIWKRSQGEITNLLAFKDLSSATSLKEDQLLDHTKHDRIVILCDVAGMGKSTILTNLAQKMKHDESSLLILKINLIRHTTVLAEELANRTFSSNDTDAAIHFLVNKLLGLKTNLDSQVYKTIIKDEAKAVLLLDGFDEISPTYDNIVIDLLLVLKNLNIKRIHVTTRPHRSQVLEAKLGTFSRTLQLFSPEDQITFLVEFWKQRLNQSGSSKPSKERLEIHAISVLNLLSSINREMKTFMGVPLQIMMVAEIYQYNSTGSGESLSGPYLPKSININHLYEEFVVKKYQIYCKEKKNNDHTKLGEVKDNKITHQIFLITHQKLALDALFNGNTVKLLLNSQPDVLGMYKLFCSENVDEELTGLVTHVIHGIPQFVHLTFAEYFTAVFLLRSLKDDQHNQEVREFFLKELFVKSQYKTVRAFLNCLLSGETYEIENKSWEVDLGENCNADNGETIYHTAATEGNIHIVMFFINRLCELRSDQTPEYDTFHPVCENLIKVESTAECEEQESNSSVEYSEQESISSVDCEEPKTIHSNIDLRDNYGRTPLQIAVRYSMKHFDILRCFVEGGAKVNYAGSNDETPLHIAAAEENDLLLNAVQYLVENKAYIESNDANGYTPLYKAAAAGNAKIVDYLIENGADANSKGNDGSTPLHAAVIAGNLEVIDYLLDHGVDINQKINNDYTVLHTAIEAEDLRTVEHLISSGADVHLTSLSGCSPLEYASSYEFWDIFDCLIENGADINSVTNLDDVPSDMLFSIVEDNPGLAWDSEFWAETLISAQIHRENEKERQRGWRND